MAIDRLKLHINILSHLLENPFPHDDVEIIDSMWGQWLARVDEGQQKEHDWVSSQVKDLDPEEADYFSDEYWKAIELTDHMYAAFIVAMWSKMEVFFKYCIRLCEVLGCGDFEGDVHKIKDVAQYLQSKAGVNLKTVVNSEKANIVRVLANCFKHSGGRYTPDSYPLDLAFASEHSIEEHKKINYSKIQLKNLLVGCSGFCEAIKTELKSLPHSVV